MRRTLLKNGVLIDPSRNFEGKRDLFLVDGKVERIAEFIDEKEDGVEILDCADKFIFPGFIDLHTHLREPGGEAKEDVGSGCRAAVAGGFTAVCSMPNTMPRQDTASTIKYVIRRAFEESLCRVYPVGAITKKIEGEQLTEIGDLVGAGAVALSDDGNTIQNSEIMRRAFEYAKIAKVPLALHCLDRYLMEEGVMYEGSLSTRLGLQGIPSEAETVIVARDIALCRSTGGRYHVQHLFTARGVELIRWAKSEGLPISAEVTPHHLALTCEAVGEYNTNSKVAPPLGSEEDRQALIEGLVDGTIDAIATDHAPHTDMEKDLTFDEAPFGMIGLETAVPVTWDLLVKSGRMTPMEWARRLSTNPARLFQLKGGTLVQGTHSDVTVIDPNETRTYRREDVVSKGKNSPFLGRSFTGWPYATLVGGRIVYHRDRGK